MPREELQGEEAGLVDSPSDILDHMLQKTIEKFPQRYGQCLADANFAHVKAFLMDALRKEVWDVFARRDFTLNS